MRPYLGLILTFFCTEQQTQKGLIQAVGLPELEHLGLLLAGMSFITRNIGHLVLTAVDTDKEGACYGSEQKAQAQPRLF